MKKERDALRAKVDQLVFEMDKEASLHRRELRKRAKELQEVRG